MKLLEVLKMIDNDVFPLVAEKNKYCKRESWEVDCRPNSVFRINICFMCEEETWLHTHVNSPILIPWYECEVSSFNPSDESMTIDIWLDSDEYMIANGWVEKVVRNENGVFEKVGDKH